MVFKYDSKKILFAEDAYHEMMLWHRPVSEVMKGWRCVDEGQVKVM
jgi:hypothetical protein